MSVLLKLADLPEPEDLTTVIVYSGGSHLVMGRNDAQADKYGQEVAEDARWFSASLGCTGPFTWAEILACSSHVWALGDLLASGEVP